MFIVPFSVSSIREVKIHDSYFHNKASQSPANKLLYGCTIDFTFTRRDLKGLWDCPWIPNLCATHSLSSWHSVSSVNSQDYSLNRISLPFILWTTGQSGRWQPSDSIQMEMKESGGMVLFVKHGGEPPGSRSRFLHQTGSRLTLTSLTVSFQHLEVHTLKLEKREPQVVLWSNPHADVKHYTFAWFISIVFLLILRRRTNNLCLQRIYQSFSAHSHYVDNNHITITFASNTDMEQYVLCNLFPVPPRANTSL